MYVGFAVKVPTIPFHVWLPEAHVEAPTVGSVLLAGLLLKLGGVAYIRIILPIFTEANIFSAPVVYTLCLVSVWYSALITVRQIDLKRIVAYSSISHMNMSVLGILSHNFVTLQGGIYLMLGHGVVSGGLFYLIGVLYVRHGTRLIYYYGGLTTKMPLFSVYFLLFCMSNAGIPGFVNFVGELLLLTGIFQKNIYVGFAVLWSSLPCVVYCI